MSVKVRLTRKREYETPEYAGFVRRSIRAHGRRVADADPEDLRELVEMRGTLDEAIAVAVDGLRSQQRSWADIARALGISRQAAQQRFGEPRAARAAGLPGQLDLWS